MKKFSFVLVTILSLALISCSNSQSEQKLSPKEFSMQLQNAPEISLVDVRTPEEFQERHLQNAKNIDWNGENFEQEISLLDKSKPTFVYCRSGARSASAAAKMREMGFRDVRELQGGIIAWQPEDLPVELE